MYTIKEPKMIKFENQTKASEEIGIKLETLSRILNKKQKTTKVVAYCIVKHYDENAEIQDYFDRLD